VQPLSLAAALILLSAPAFSQDNDGNRKGKLSFNSSCRTCHSLDAGDNRLGPNLHRIVGREAGSEEYAYSQPLTTSDLVWDAETLDRFIKDPQAVIPGNNMKPYGGISDAEVRASIVSYLSEVSSEGDDESQ
jgi:cytochrome c